MVEIDHPTHSPIKPSIPEWVRWFWLVNQVPSCGRVAEEFGLDGRWDADGFRIERDCRAGAAEPLEAGDGHGRSRSLELG